MYYNNYKNCYSMNNNFDCDNYQCNYDNNNHNDNCYKNNLDKRSCCMRRVEETFMCFPSYYNEEKEEVNNYKKDVCYEGTFKICPKYCENKKNIYNKDCDEEIVDQVNKKNCYHCQHRCGFCGLFRR